MYKQAFHKHCQHHHGFGPKKFGGQYYKRDFKDFFGMDAANPPANVREIDDAFELQLVAPGYEKKDFTIAIIDNKISISVSMEDGKLEENWKRQEYIPGDFLREFELNEKVDKSAITAKYNKGILSIKLPKLEGFETSREKIEIQ
jgi:HSP20 family protein